jgi:hypothetical protein
MLQRLKDYFFQPKLRTAAATRDFVSSQASYLAQRTSLEFSRNTLAYSHQYMMHQDSFIDEMRKCRWESFAALIEDMLVALEGYLRPADAAAQQRLAAALVAMARSILEGYERPTHRPQGWDDVLQRIAVRLDQARLAPPQAPHAISAVSAARLYDLMPVYSPNKPKDQEAVDGAVRFGFAGFAAKLAAALEPEPVRAELLAAPQS